MSKYEAVYFVGDNQAINRVRIDSSKTRNRGAFSGSLAALVKRNFFKIKTFCPTSKTFCPVSFCPSFENSTYPKQKYSGV